MAPHSSQCQSETSATEPDGSLVRRSSARVSETLCDFSFIFNCKNTLTYICVSSAETPQTVVVLVRNDGDLVGGDQKHLIKTAAGKTTITGTCKRKYLLKCSNKNSQNSEKTSKEAEKKRKKSSNFTETNRKLEVVFHLLNRRVFLSGSPSERPSTLAIVPRFLQEKRPLMFLILNPRNEPPQREGPRSVFYFEGIIT